MRDGTEEELATAVNHGIANAAYEAAAKMYPKDRIDLRHGARVISKSKPE